MCYIDIYISLYTSGNTAIRRLFIPYIYKHTILQLASPVFFFWWMNGAECCLWFSSLGHRVASLSPFVLVVHSKKKTNKTTEHSSWPIALLYNIYIYGDGLWVTAGGPHRRRRRRRRSNCCRPPNDLAIASAPSRRNNSSKTRAHHSCFSFLLLGLRFSHIY